MSAAVVIDPDAFLEIEDGRIWTPERNAEAWRLALAALRAALAADSVERLVVVCGLQGAGKSTWIARQLPQAGRVYLDAALPGRRHRAPILAVARACGVAAEAVWIRAPLSVAFERNRRRAPDRQVPEASIRSVDRLFEPPSDAEGFAAIRIVDATSLAG
ncbi:kinase [Methylobacterium sp. P1-11]|uniref:AAA family ATPase n=1 Tax=Methylobacterium sp. P1-11 TaxID=2024616 RepID=UPI0011ED23E8|nr:AAA family ATPase [Methylobacterium sp. P1-11]KAA0125248.1 kinase [Methylobacterium sp. P1-11]